MIKILAILTTGLLAVACFTETDSETHYSGEELLGLEGSWLGGYSCGSLASAPNDQFEIIRVDTNNNTMTVKIHTTAANPDVVYGDFVASDEVEFRDQDMGGAAGALNLKIKNINTINYTQWSPQNPQFTCGGEYSPI